jgi:hypothetical protein
MEIIILNSAYKHGVSKAGIFSCLLNFRYDAILDDPPPKRLFIGFDHAGNALEVIAIENYEQSCLVVIHAMKLRKMFYHLLRRSIYEL